MCLLKLKKVENPVRTKSNSCTENKKTNSPFKESVNFSQFFLIDTDGSWRSRVNEARSVEDKELLISTGFNISS